MQLAINHMVYRDREFESTTVKGSCLQFGLDSSSSWAGLVILIVCSESFSARVCPLQFVFHVNLLIYDVVKEQWILFLFTEHTVGHPVMFGVLLLTQQFFYPKGHLTCCGDFMLWRPLLKIPLSSPNLFPHVWSWTQTCLSFRHSLSWTSAGKL